jgi:NitT/TauT family transport system substrate-binding protein
MRNTARRIALAVGSAALLALAACGSDDGSSDDAAATTAAASATTAAASATTAAAADTTAAAPDTTAEPAESSEPVTLRLGYFPNITHATALVGVESGIFEEHLGDNVTLQTSTFNAGGQAIEALFADAIDASYIGPNPAINGFAQSDGEALRIVSGATSGGAFLVVKPEITSAADLKGKKIASPALGNTQDVALRAWLKEQGLSADESGGGDVSILPQENSATLEAFVAGDIDGAWVPEPWATRLIQEGGATVLVDERDLWPDGKYVTTQLIVATKFLDAHPDVVKQLLEGQVAANDFVNANPAEAQTLANDQIEKITQKRVKDEVLTAAWKNLTFTNDPVASSLTTSAESAVAIGLLDPVDLEGIYSLDLLNEVLEAAGEPTVGAT